MIDNNYIIVQYIFLFFAAGERLLYISYGLIFLEASRTPVAVEAFTFGTSDIVVVVKLLPPPDGISPLYITTLRKTMEKIKK